MLAAFCVMLWGTGAYGLHVYRGGNFHTVTQGMAYRSAQLNATDLERRIQQNGIKTIINLREWEPSMGWYQEETAMARKYDVVHQDFVLSEYVELPPAMLDNLSSLLETSPKPILIHCAGGADRTGLVSALFRYQLEQEPAEQCFGEFSARYGHVPWLRPGVQAMQRSFTRYVTLRPHGALGLPGNQWHPTGEEPAGPAVDVGSSFILWTVEQTNKWDAPGPR